jgi:hypothetical protein
MAMAEPAPETWPREEEDDDDADLLELALRGMPGSQVPEQPPAGPPPAGPPPTGPAADSDDGEDLVRLALQCGAASQPAGSSQAPAAARPAESAAASGCGGAE